MEERGRYEVNEEFSDVSPQPTEADIRVVEPRVEQHTGRVHKQISNRFSMSSGSDIEEAQVYLNPQAWKVPAEISDRRSTSTEAKREDAQPHIEQHTERLFEENSDQSFTSSEADMEEAQPYSDPQAWKVCTCADTLDRSSMSTETAEEIAEPRHEQHTERVFKEMSAQSSVYSETGIEEAQVYLDPRPWNVCASASDRCSTPTEANM